ncbi:MAG: transporter [Bdellovibrionota bacterium]
MKKTIVIGMCLGMGAAFAGDLKAPFSLPSARVLPKGVRNLSYKNVMATAENKYGANGESVVIADPFFKNITFADVIKGKLDPVDKGAVKQAMLSIGASETDSFGQTTGQVNIAATAHVPVFAWGFSSKFTGAIAVPILKSSQNVSTGVIQQNQALHDSMKAALTAKGVDFKVAEFDNKMVDPIQSKLEEYGYKRLENEDKSQLGDIRLVAKYLALDTGANRIVVSNDLTVPTGKDSDVNEVVDVASGDDQWDVGAGVAYDYVLNDYWTISTDGSYTFQLPDRNPERIPMYSDSKVTPDVDGNTERDLGDIAAFNAAGKWRYEGVNLGAGYTYQYKSADRYNGNAYASSRYDMLEQDTVQHMHGVVVTGGYDTMTLFKAKKFPVPLSLTLSHTRVMSGMNVVNDPITALDFSMFF